MVNPTEFKTFTRSIVADFYPDELFAFDISADDLIKKINLDGNIETETSKKTAINFMEQAVSVLGFVGILISTYRAIVEVRSLQLKNKIDKIEAETKWLQLLQDSGIPKEECDKIVSKHFNQFSDLMSK